MICFNRFKFLAEASTKLQKMHFFGQFRDHNSGSKYLSFGQKLPIWTAHHTFLESRHPEVTKYSYYNLAPEGSQKKVPAHGLRVEIEWTSHER